ncbi:hypothetical protein [Neptunomonas concharum]|uniref:hypothetical protein n=1 Tax=Neptunomonas concharum TaxID=1031538 RepID=UPI00147787A3|nr:hypothetical protein [Neptunomonas concharum]
MYSKIRDPQEWLERQEALLDTYIERVFESRSIEEWFSASHWYLDAIRVLFQPDITAN